MNGPFRSPAPRPPAARRTASVIQGSFRGGLPVVQARFAANRLSVQAAAQLHTEGNRLAGLRRPGQPGFQPNQPQVAQAHKRPGVEAFPVDLRPKTGGQSLPPEVQAKMESALGADFSDVRIHVGREAASVGAIAFTWGSNIHFAPGQYDPQTTQGQRLLGHELAHVVQQRAGRVSNPFGSGVAVVQDHALEAEADRLGARAAMTPVAPQSSEAAQPKLAPHRAIVQRFSAQPPRQTSGGAQTITVTSAGSRSPVGSVNVSSRDNGVLRHALRGLPKPEAGHRKHWPPPSASAIPSGMAPAPALPSRRLPVAVLPAAQRKPAVVPHHPGGTNPTPGPPPTGPQGNHGVGREAQSIVHGGRVRLPKSTIQRNKTDAQQYIKKHIPDWKGRVSKKTITAYHKSNQPHSVGLAEAWNQGLTNPGQIIKIQSRLDQEAARATTRLKAKVQVLAKDEGDLLLAAAYDKCQSIKFGGICEVVGFRFMRVKKRLYIGVSRATGKKEAKTLKKDKQITHKKYTDSYKWFSESQAHTVKFVNEEYNDNQAKVLVWIDADYYIPMRAGLMHENSSAHEKRNRFHQEGVSSHRHLINIGIHSSLHERLNAQILKVTSMPKDITYEKVELRGAPIRRWRRDYIRDRVRMRSREDWLPPVASRPPPPPTPPASTSLNTDAQRRK